MECRRLPPTRLRDHGSGPTFAGLGRSYVHNRALHGALMAFAVSIFTVALLELAPGTYFDELKANPTISRETITLRKTKYGLDQSLPLRYEHWLKSSLRGDLGLSLAYN